MPNQARFAQRELEVDSVCFLGLLGLKLVFGDLGLGSELVLGDLGLGIIGIGRILCVRPGLNLAPRGRWNLELSSGAPPSNKLSGRRASDASKGISFVPIEGVLKLSSNSSSRPTQVSQLVSCTVSLRAFLTPPSGISCLKNLPAFATSSSNMVSGIFFIANSDRFLGVLSGSGRFVTSFVCTADISGFVDGILVGGSNVFSAFCCIVVVVSVMHVMQV